MRRAFFLIVQAGIAIAEAARHPEVVQARSSVQHAGPRVVLARTTIGGRFAHKFQRTDVGCGSVHAAGCG